MTMLGQDEHETDTKNRLSTNSASELTNPLKMVKKQYRFLNCSILMSEVSSKLSTIWAQMSSKQTLKT